MADEEVIVIEDEDIILEDDNLMEIENLLDDSSDEDRVLSEDSDYNNDCNSDITNINQRCVNKHRIYDRNQELVPFFGPFDKFTIEIEANMKKASAMAGVSRDRLGSTRSINVVSLFTNVPIDLAMDSINNRWNYISDNSNIPRNKFLNAIRFVLDSTFFTFNDIIYRQTFGTPMGSPLSPIIADITLQDLEMRAIEILPISLSFYYRYVDDVVLAAPPSTFSAILQTFNSFHPRLQFTMEEEADNRLNFLDTTIILENNIINFDWYHKPTYSGRYLNFESRHPLCQKKGTAISLIDRAFRLSHPRFHQKNFELNDTTQTTIPTDSASNNRTHYFNIPYIPLFSEQFRPVVRDLQTKISYTGLNKLKKFIRVQKDRLHNEMRNNVVYKITCKNCNASYVGQTSRLLKTRIAEHKNHIRKNTAQHSVITDHRPNNHEFAWDEVEVLDEERIYGKRLMSEMIFITRQTNSLNLQSDTENLHHAYLRLVELSKIGYQKFKSF
ncbi:uncharacterized protein [Polyergus mexicanus]|uniref:uncharacterized protein n=1 Tax=Polyergus mexicanus TaxID=615972 RepID=UPI0038B5403F